MLLPGHIRQKKHLQYLIGIIVIVVIAIPCFFLVNVIGYKVVALILLLAVSVLAMLFDIFPVLAAAFLSALIWNFFFIPPLYKFSIGTTEDILLFLMYFAIAMLNAVLTSRIRIAELKVRDKEEREKTIKLYNTLLNSLSHELRTPISTIIGAVDTLLNQDKKLTGTNRHDLLSEIHIAGMRLNRQVENLLSMSRLESGFVKPKIDWCDVNELIYKVVQSNLSETVTHDIIYSPNEALPLYKLDRGFIEQALHNIIHNATQHTAIGTTVEIMAYHQNDALSISVTDNGKGFPEDQLETVFEKFYRLPESTSGGTGLGLSIAKGFIEAHGGQITLENVKGKGARFNLTIPAAVSYSHEV